MAILADQTSGTADRRAFDRTPPQDIDAERAVLGAMLVSKDAVASVVEVLSHGTGALFYAPAHQLIYEAIVNLFRLNLPVDHVTVLDRLQTHNVLAKVGGAAYLAELPDAAPTAANADYYARIVLEKAIKRHLIEICARITSRTYEGPHDVDDLLDVAEKEIFALNEQRALSPIHHLASLVMAGVCRIDDRIKNKGMLTGLPTGVKQLDNLLSGLQSSDMVVLAARPSVGKTAFALNIANHAAIKHDKSVLLFSLEMAKEQLVQRLLCMVGKVNAARLRDGFLVEAEFPKVQDAADILSRTKIYIDESSSLTPLELRSKARRHSAQYPLDLVIVDYMQLMHTGGRSENRQNEISDISRAMKGLARELHVPVLALSQLSREAEKDDAGIPKLSHLRESGAIEQDADVVIILARLPKSKQNEQNRNNIIVNIAKQRNGPTGWFELLFNKELQQFLPLEKSADAEQAVPYAAPPSIPAPRYQAANIDSTSDDADDDLFDG